MVMNTEEKAKQGRKKGREVLHGYLYRLIREDSLVIWHSDKDVEEVRG